MRPRLPRPMPALLAAATLLAVTGCGADPSAGEAADAAPAAAADDPSPTPSGDATPSADGAADDAAATPAPSEEPVNRTVTPSELRTGMCLVLPSGDVVANFSAIDCELEHDLEVITVADLDTDAETYPGRESLEEAAYMICEGPAFEHYVGTPYQESSIYVEAMVPTPESWASGNRDAYCMAYVPDERLTGSVRDSDL